QRAAALAAGAPRHVVVIDQLEELFTTGHDAAVQHRFFDELSAIVWSDAGNTAVAVIVRADYYGMCGAHARFARLLEESHVLVGAMRADELRQAIVDPAARSGYRVEPALVDLVCRHAGSEPGALPLVSTAL